MRAAHHARLPRHLRDRPRQPAGSPTICSSRSTPADRPRSAVRGQGAHGFARRRCCIPLDEAQVAGRRAASGRRGRRGRSRSCSCIPIAMPPTSSAPRRSSETESAAAFVTASHELSQEYREFERTSTAAANAYVGPRVQTYLGEMEAHLGEPASPANSSSCSRPAACSTSAQARRRMHPHAEVRAGRRRHRHARRCATASISERHRVRHGRHHRQGRRDLRRHVLMTGQVMVGGYAKGCRCRCR